VIAAMHPAAAQPCIKDETSYHDEDKLVDQVGQVRGERGPGVCVVERYPFCKGQQGSCMANAKRRLETTKGKSHPVVTIRGVR